MFALIQLVGFLVIIYLLAVRILMLCNKCSEKEAKEMIADWWQENTSGQPKNDYELSRDCNYDYDINSTVKDILGEARYDELCKLARHSSALVFNDTHAGFPTVKITANCNDKNEEKRLQRILESKTRQYILSYGDPANAKVLSIWSENQTLQLPMLIIMYSRNKKEKEMLDRIEQSDINKITRRSVVRRGAFRR